MSMEIVLQEELFESSKLSSVVVEAEKRGFKMTNLTISRVMNRGQAYKSLEKSTTPKAIIYFESERKQAVILQGPEDEQYRLFDYAWIA